VGPSWSQRPFWHAGVPFQVDQRRSVVPGRVPGRATGAGHARAAASTREFTHRAAARAKALAEPDQTYGAPSTPSAPAHVPNPDSFPLNENFDETFKEF
jgi:hypothetical protein